MTRKSAIQSTPVEKSRATRREFLETSTTAALAGALLAPLGSPAAAASAAGDTLRIGLIGCGQRGTGAAFNALQADPRVELTALGDVFPDKLESSLAALQKRFPDQVKVDAGRRFLGFDSHHKVAASDVDVVLLTTPPAFRPQHLRAAVDAGKHSFVEITAAIDAPGVRSVLESAEIARTKNLAIVSGFCWRYHHAHRAVVEQIRQGAIGDIRAVYATYYRNDLGSKYHGERTAKMTDVEWQLRDWYDQLWLSGDVTILLSGGHSVDKISWWLGDVMPTKAVAVGSRVHPIEGNTFDNCFVVYEYASGIRSFLGCRSQTGVYAENADYIIGSKGVCTIGRGRVPVIEGENPWKYTGVMNNMYQTEHDELFASIRAGKPINDGARMANTTLMGILGRMAAYTGKELTWEQALGSQQKLVPDAVTLEMKVEQPPLSIPGLTPFV